MPYVLLAEDDTSLRELVADSLRASGHRVEAVADGGRLLVALGQAMRRGVMPDLIVSDVNMAVMSGLEMAAALHETRGRVPLVLMTAFPDDRTLARARALRAHMLAKPFELEDLARLVDVCLTTPDAAGAERHADDGR